jgi:hypothetical protein
MRDMMPGATPPCCAGEQMMHCGSAYPAHLRSFRGSLTLDQRGALCSSPHHQTCNAQHYGRVAQAQRMVTCAAAVRDSPPAQQRQQGGPTEAITTPSDGRDGFLALKEWAVTCAALAAGQQTVSACVSVEQHAVLDACSEHIVIDESAM